MLFKEGAQLFVGHVQTTAVYPCQIGAFWIPHLQRSDGVDLLAEIVHIGFDVGIQLIQPLVALGVCSNDNRINKDVAAADVQVVEQLFEFVAQLFILDDDVGSLKTCQVEGFAGSGAQDGAVSYTHLRSAGGCVRPVADGAREQAAAGQTVPGCGQAV